LNRPLHKWLLLGAVLSLAACGPQPARRTESDRASDARIIAEAASRAAVAKVGARVCKTLTVGISERDVIRGVVTEVSADKIRVKLEAVGRFPNHLDGVPLAVGALVPDDPLNWAPCS
jgi:hypothetical protein